MLSRTCKVAIKILTIIIVKRAYKIAQCEISANNRQNYNEQKSQ